MALSFAPASILMPLQIRNPEVVSKSYPHYWEDLKSTGFQIEKGESERA
jgi:3-phosphoshikimate 1-carboxyvinyltransferase